jgi:hypothetical protein
MATCSACGVAVQAVHRPSNAQHRGPVQVLADGRTVSVCTDHGPTDETLRSAVLVAIGSRLTYGSRSRGVARCGACGDVLDLPMRTTTRSATVEPPDGPPFTLTLMLPVVRCGRCGIDAVPPELVDALIGCALGAAGVPDDRSSGAHTAHRLRTFGSQLISRRRRRAEPGSPWSPSHA